MHDLFAVYMFTKEMLRLLDCSITFEKVRGRKAFSVFSLIYVYRPAHEAKVLGLWSQLTPLNSAIPLGQIILSAPVIQPSTLLISAPEGLCL